ncbi:MAG: Ku protein [Deltaproteobacteria bacterium]|nr:Ku protein [Deltaproteobacteria bacterium]
MPHAIWKGSISFGLVNIPVGLYSAESREEKFDFHLLDKQDLSPVGYKKISKRTGKELKQEDLVKGYEYEEGRYVVLSEEDFRRANVKATQTVEIIDFVDASEIHPVFYEKPYYLAPVGRGQKSYALLREALKKTGKAGVAKVVIHSKEYVGVVLAYQKILVLNLLRYSAELRKPDYLEVPEEDLKKLGVSDKELDMAQKLVEGMIAGWNPEKYHDTYKQELKTYIQKKIEAGETAKVEEARPEEAVRPQAEVIDLMSLLKKSIEQTEIRQKKAASK